MKIKEFGKLLLTAVLMVGILPVLAGATTVVSIPNVSLNASENTTVPIMISGVDNAKGAHIVLSYNSSIVQVTNIGNSAFGLETFKSIDNVTGLTRYAVLSLSPLSGNIKFADVTLKAVANAGSSPLNLGVVSLNNGTGEIPRTVQNGTFTIGAAQPQGTIIGTVTNARSGAAIADASVTAGSMTATTDANGNYSISIAPATYTVTASKSGYTSSASVTVASGATVTQNFELPIIDNSGVAAYDSNKDGIIQKGEAVQAVLDYFDYIISKAQAVDVVLAYFS